jgi:hypothetical protein
MAPLRLLLRLRGRKCLMASRAAFSLGAPKPSMGTISSSPSNTPGRPWPTLLTVATSLPAAVMMSGKVLAVDVGATHVDEHEHEVRPRRASSRELALGFLLGDELVVLVDLEVRRVEIRAAAGPPSCTP